MSSQKTITYHQIRAARALIDWSQEDLAKKSGLSIATIRKIETGNISPRDKTNDDIRHAFENAGLEFIEPGGVRQRPEDIKIYQGREGAKAFFDDVYETAKAKSCEIVQVWPTSYRFSEVIGDYKNIHYERMGAIKRTTKVRSIITENQDTFHVAPYCECRWISKSYVYSVPFYIYDDKYAIIMLDTNPSPKITVIQSPALADAFRQQFYSMWEKATPLNKVEKKPDHSKRKSARGA